jgi:hypothetical protein
MRTQIYSKKVGNQETLVYVTIGNKGNAVYHKLNSIEKIVYESPLDQKIIFSNGEIELRVLGNQLRISSKSYSANGEARITNQIVKQLGSAYTPESALTRAKNDIIQRVTNLEMNAQEMKVKQEMNDYLNNYLDSLNRRRLLAVSTRNNNRVAKDVGDLESVI